MTRHRLKQVRPRYGRMLLAAASVSVTGVAVLGGVGVLPVAQADGTRSPPGAALSTTEVIATPTPAATATPAPESAPDSTLEDTVDDTVDDTQVAPPADQALPPGSGDGRRVVFSEGSQRVWLVDEDGTVARTYLVSGSVHDNLDPGEYAVYSRSEQAWGIEDSGTMRWFVRFTRGDNAAIGFHDIPVDDGARVQTVSQLGTPLSHGCIRQKQADAKQMWAFAQLGTKVVVTA